ncbi:MAG: TlpA family protein disulfide reductase [Bacteroides sp.]|nr:TlpA family protein disulfide reductase [Bacteroides sp.]
MKKIFVLLLVVMGLTACVTEEDEPVWSLQVGEHLPEFSIVMNDGRTVTTQSLAGKRSVIVFFTTTCSDCRRELPRYQEWYNQIISSGDDVNFICISREEGADAVSTYWKEHDFTMPYSPQSDRAVYNLFASSGVPRVYEANAELIITNVE